MTQHMTRAKLPIATEITARKYVKYLASAELFSNIDIILRALCIKALAQSV